MSGCDYSCLPNGGDPVGMTDNQYKGMLLDQLEDWQEVLDLAIKAGNTEIQDNHGLMGHHLAFFLSFSLTPCP